jgi:hypothetical protein
MPPPEVIELELGADGNLWYTAPQARTEYIDNRMTDVGVGLMLGGYVLHLSGVNQAVFVGQSMIDESLASGRAPDDTVHADRDAAQVYARSRGAPYAYYRTINGIIAPTVFSPASTPRISATARAGFQQLGELGARVFTELALSLIGARIFSAVLGRVFRWSETGSFRAPPALTAGQISIRAILGEVQYAEYRAAATAAQAANPALSALSIDEIVAIRAYSNNSWARMNLALRSGQTGGLEMYAEVNRMAASGLRKLPGYAGTVTRTEAWNIAEARALYQPGQTIRLQGFTSTTRLAGGVAQREGNVLLTVEATGGAGKDITGMAVHSEAEILFVPGARFQVQSALPAGDGALLVRLREIP